MGTGDIDSSLELNNMNEHKSRTVRERPCLKYSVKDSKERPIQRVPVSAVEEAGEDENLGGEQSNHCHFFR